ncbi:MAG: AI-2E family transporter [Actinomycetota bacterium]|nr:AI-2E family transporter [Actinomycetota bacterium]
MPTAPEREIRFRPRTVLAVLLIVIAVGALLQLLWMAREVITWILIAAFLALALNPVVAFLQRRGIRRRGLAAGLTFILAIIGAAGLGTAFVPILLDEIRQFADALPGYVEDLTAGRGPLGFLESDYQIVERVRQAVADGNLGERVLGASGTALAIAEGILTAVVATITIAVMTFFMLLEGPSLVDRFLGQLPPASAARWRRILHQVYLTVGGYVSGALLIALVAGLGASLVLWLVGVPYAFALGLLVALLDLVPLAGATIATVLVSTIAFLDSVPVGIAVLVYFVLYQQLENHVLYPLVYSRTVELSPLVILVAVLIGASIAGILGALAAIPVAGTIQVLVREWLEYRRELITAVEEQPGSI